MVGKYFEICCPQMAKTALEQHIFQGNIHIFSLKVLPPECARWSVCVSARGRPFVYVSVCDGVCACLKKGVGYAACV